MFYYFDENTRRCAHMSSGPLAADHLLEIEDGKHYPEINALRCEESDGVYVIVEDEKLLADWKLQEAKESLKTTIDHNITKWQDAEEFGDEEEVAHAKTMSQKWREFRFKVERATELPLPPIPEDESNE